MKTKFVEYNVVKSTRSLTEIIPKGTFGTILMVFAGQKPSYEVEFVDYTETSLGTLTVNEDDLELFTKE